MATYRIFTEIPIDKSDSASGATKCVLQQHSAIHAIPGSKSTGPWDIIDHAPFADKCIGDKVPQLSPGPFLLLNDTVERACKVFQKAEELDSNKYPQMPHLRDIPVTRVNSTSSHKYDDEFAGKVDDSIVDMRDFSNSKAQNKVCLIRISYLFRLMSFFFKSFL